jgi:hypothetical protein
MAADKQVEACCVASSQVPAVAEQVTSNPAAPTDTYPFKETVQSKSWSIWLLKKEVSLTSFVLATLINPVSMITVIIIIFFMVIFFMVKNGGCCISPYDVKLASMRVP